ncbi:hypothetical protein G6F50_016999 [Rhizopus delemar]|uniref:Uncharacterized protein n=1 Tax=Rhizopus delemar TaxID=936053 RepID=A0A9P6XSA2_9FUNG|nr:hypothetical protein G6F50_016999 [Rhizopus delemar]
MLAEDMIGGVEDEGTAGSGIGTLGGHGSTPCVDGGGSEPFPAEWAPTPLPDQKNARMPNATPRPGSGE